jgi:hypothetical protein
MGAVYENSTCTIAAVGASDTGTGCFDVRNPLTYTSCEVTDTTDHGCYFRRDHDEHVYTTVARKSPLFERAWAVQENLLSPRVLFFTEQMFWSCRQGHATERFFQGWSEPTTPHEARNLFQIKPIFGHNQPSPIPRPTHFDWHSRGRNAYSAMRAMKHISTPSEYNIVHNSWFEAVHYYSQGKLTKASNKLAALSGVAERVQETTKLEYLAGLWKENLPLDLLWYVIRPYGRGITNYERPSEYRAPTWSWASVDGEIRTLNGSYNLTSYENDDRMDNLEPAFEVVNVQVTTSELDPAKTGRVLAASLAIHGTLRGTPSSETRLEPWKTQNDDGGIRFSVRYDDSHDCVDIYPGSKMDLDLRKAFFFSIVQSNHSQDVDLDPQISRVWRHKGLVLVSMGNFYQRVGVFDIWKFAHGGSSLKKWKQWLDSGKRETIVIR